MTGMKDDFRDELCLVVGRGIVDETFRRRFLADPAATISAYDYRLHNQEPRAATELIKHVMARLDTEGAATRQRTEDVRDHAVRTLEDTLTNAAKTYKSITFMNKAMFAAGLAIFVSAAAYGVVSERPVAPLAFAGIGATTFVAIFLIGAINKSQAALSNLVQVEIAFMTYFEQLAFSEAMAMLGGAAGDRPAFIERASRLLQIRAVETVDLLQRYVEARSPGSREPQHRGEGQTS
jgi:hypothetical protein